jgi:hypothetical protein
MRHRYHLFWVIAVAGWYWKLSEWNPNCSEPGGIDVLPVC